MFRRQFIFLAISLLFASAGGPAFAQPVDANAKAKTETSQPELSKENAAILETCFKCHGKGGVSQIPTHPTIAGQKAGYLVKQLNEFKRAQETLNEKILAQPEKQKEEKNSVLSGRNDFIMSHMVEGFNKNNFTSLAVYISLLPCDGVVSPNDEVDQGEKTQTPPSIIGRCVACHGENGISSQPSVPNLAGQRRAYLRRELLLMRETAWGGNNTDKNEWRAHPIMEQQAARLKIEDVDSIANYYSQLNCRGK
ncbi:MAG: c-type cytochrome [Rhodospirillaceae bacterium]|nr:c-type cytochrome [Rhodospirillaceae bacterium]